MALVSIENQGMKLKDTISFLMESVAERNENGAKLIELVKNQSDELYNIYYTSKLAKNVRRKHCVVGSLSAHTLEMISWDLFILNENKGILDEALILASEIFEGSIDVVTFTERVKKLTQEMHPLLQKRIWLLLSGYKLDDKYYF